MKIVNFTGAERSRENKGEPSVKYNFFRTGVACFYVRFYDAKDEEEFKFIVNAFSAKTNLEVSENDGTYSVIDRTISDPHKAVETPWGIMLRKYMSLSNVTRIDQIKDVKYFPIRFDDVEIPECSRLELAC
jgi:hypothetical protein